jgi:hypothetical protein
MTGVKSPQKEDRFRQLVEGVRDYAICLLDPDGAGCKLEHRRRADRGIQGR